MRVHLKKLLGVTSYKEMAEQNPPLNDDEIFNYEASGPQYFNKDNFRIDFVQPWREFPFNLSARDFFANHLLSVLKGGSYKKASIPPRYHTYDHIGDALDVHMEHARKRYRQEIEPPTPSDKEKERRKNRMVSRRGTVRLSRFRRDTLLLTRSCSVTQKPLQGDEGGVQVQSLLRPPREPKWRAHEC